MQTAFNIILVISILFVIIGIFGVLNSLIYIVPMLHLYQSFILNGTLIAIIAYIILRVTQEV